MGNNLKNYEVGATRSDFPIIRSLRDSSSSSIVNTGIDLFRTFYEGEGWKVFSIYFPIM